MGLSGLFLDPVPYLKISLIYFPFLDDFYILLLVLRRINEIMFSSYSLGKK